MESRIQYSKPSLRYNNSTVRIGNWFEEQCSYKKNNFKHETEYSTEYKHQPNPTNRGSFLWNEKFKSEGHGIYPTKKSDEVPNYFENYSSSYDLSYRYFPKLLADKSSCYDHRHLEFIPSYGNITHYGIGDLKKTEWISDNDMRKYTLNNVHFEPPKQESYHFLRWSLPTAIKTKYGKEYKPFPRNHPRFSNCNPITWECDNVCVTRLTE